MSEINNEFNEGCSSNLITLGENHFHKDGIGLWLSKLTQNFKNALFLKIYFQILVTVREDMITQGWSVIKTTPLVECGTFCINLKGTLMNHHIVHNREIQPKSNPKHCPWGSGLLALVLVPKHLQCLADDFVKQACKKLGFLGFARVLASWWWWKGISKS